MTTETEVEPAIDSKVLQKLKIKVHNLISRHKFDELRQLGVETGFQHREVREMAWPVLIESFGDPMNIEVPTKLVSCHTEQIEKDIPRSLYKYQPDPEKLAVDQRRLSKILNSVFAADDEIHYYQGFNDIVGTLMYVIPDDALCIRLAHHMARNQLQLCTANTMAPVTDVLGLLFSVVGAVHTGLLEHLSAAALDPFFAVGWVLTWFAHDVSSTGVIERLFDFLVCSHPLMPIYVSASLVLTERDAVLSLRPDYADLYSYLRTILTSRDPEESDWSAQAMKATSGLIAQRERDMGAKAFTAYIERVIAHSAKLFSRFRPASFRTCDVLFERYPVLHTLADDHAAPRTLPQGRVLAIGVVPVAVVLAVMLGLYMASAAPAD